MPGKGNPRVCVRLDPAVLARLRAVADDLGLSLSEFLRQMLDHYFYGE